MQLSNCDVHLFILQRTLSFFRDQPGLNSTDCAPMMILRHEVSVFELVYIYKNVINTTS